MNGSVHMMKGSAHKEMRVVLKEATRLGWVIVRWNKHCQLRPPDFPTGRPLTVPGSPKNATGARKDLMKRLHKYASTSN